MISLENKKLEKQKTSLLCRMHKSKVSRSGKKKVNMTKAEYLISGSVMSEPEYMTVSLTSVATVDPPTSMVAFPENFIGACPPWAIAESMAVVKKNSV